MSYRKTTPRGPVLVPRTPLVILVCLALILAVALFAYHAYEQRSQVEAKPATSPKIAQTHDALTVTYTNDGKKVFWYVFVDPEYGTQWVYNDHESIFGLSATWQVVDDEGYTDQREFRLSYNANGQLTLTISRNSW